MVSKKDWPRQTWLFPRVHDFRFGFGLDCDDTAATKNSTILPIIMQDNALVDYETIKTNPENEDFTPVGFANTCAGSYIPKAMLQYDCWSTSDEIDVMQFMTMDIHTSMLNRLDAFDKKTGIDIENILELTHETTDEQCYPLWNTVKLYEGHNVRDYDALIPGLTGTQQPEGVAFNLETFWDARHFYTNNNMLNKVTSNYRKHQLNGAINKDRPVREKVISFYGDVVPSLCKFQNPYTFCGRLWHCPQAGSVNQFQNNAEVTAVEHLTVMGHVRFNEYNPDFNFSRA